MNDINAEPYVPQFSLHIRNGTVPPSGWILICEDMSYRQQEILGFMAERYGGRPDILIMTLPSAYPAFAVFQAMRPQFGEPMFVLVDQDMPLGNGVQMVNALRKSRYAGKIIAFSGIPHNNEMLITAGADTAVLKGQSKWKEQLTEALSGI